MVLLLINNELIKVNLPHVCWRSCSFSETTIFLTLLEFVLHSILSTVYSCWEFTVTLLDIMSHCGFILFECFYSVYGVKFTYGLSVFHLRISTLYRLFCVLVTQNKWFSLLNKQSHCEFNFFTQYFGLCFLDLFCSVKPEKIPGLYRSWTSDLCDTGAVLSQLT